jgi:acyl-CoA thioesterase
MGWMQTNLHSQLYFYYMQSLTQILASFASHNTAYRITVDDDWLQGRTVFGGLIAALANHAMRQRVPADVVYG